MYIQYILQQTRAVGGGFLTIQIKQGFYELNILVYKSYSITTLFFFAVFSNLV